MSEAQAAQVAQTTQTTQATAEIGHYIGGKHWSGGDDSLRQAVYDPATGESHRSVILGGAMEVDLAVRSARDAWPGWAALPSLRRARILDAFRQIMLARRDDLARAVSSEHGKTHDDALGEITRGIEVLEFVFGAPHLLKGEYSESVGTGVDSHSVRQPLGVVAGITPFNFPCMVPMWMYPLALACGNCFILKPSERDPSPSLMMAEWLSEAGVPAGVFNVVQGGREAVESLLSHGGISAISFVGSTPVARHIYATATSHGKRVQALGGAKNHMVVLPDADLDMVTNALMGSAFGSAGERCMAISVVVPVGEGLADALVERLRLRIGDLRIGPASDAGSEMGPLVTAEHLARVRGYIGAGVEEGAELVVDGRAFEQKLQGYEGGYYLGGSLFDGVTPEMSIYRDEIFGPVLSVVRRDSYESALSLVHGHSQANGVSIFTRDGDSASAFARDVEVGMVGVNVPVPVPMAFYSFGGWKGSLFGDCHVYGVEGVRFYTRLKTVTTRWPGGLREDPQFVMPTLG